MLFVRRKGAESKRQLSWISWINGKGIGGKETERENKNKKQRENQTGDE